MRVAVTVISVLLGAMVGYFAVPLASVSCRVTIKDRRILYTACTAVAAGVTAWGVGARWTLIAWLWIALAGSILSFIDIEHHRLPDRLTLSSYPVVAVALLVPAFAYGQWGYYGRAWIGAVVMFLGYFVLALIYPAGMGMGDVKLAGVLGLVLGYAGWTYVFIGFFAAFFVGAFVGVGLMIFGKAGRKTAIPFGPFMFVGAVLALFLTPAAVSFYTVT